MWGNWQGRKRLIIWCFFWVDQDEIPPNAILKNGLPKTNLYFVAVERVRSVKKGWFFFFLFTSLSLLSAVLYLVLGLFFFGFGVAGVVRSYGLPSRTAQFQLYSGLLHGTHFSPHLVPRSLFPLRAHCALDCDESSPGGAQ